MQPFKPYFRGEEEPPSRAADARARSRSARWTSRSSAPRSAISPSSRCSATSRWATTSRRRPSGFALDLSTSKEHGFGLDFDDIWITVFGGDEELGLGPDEEAIEHWRALGVPDERIVLLGRDDNFWQSGPTGPCGPCSELYLDRGPDFGPDTDRPGDDTERYLEFWNLVFMQYELQADGSLPELPTKNIDTGLGLERMASILQGVPSVYETDLFSPLIEFGRGAVGQEVRRRLRDHARAADDRRPRSRCDLPAGRRRGALQRGARLRPAPHHAPRDPAGPRARNRPAVPRARVRARARHDEGRLPRARARVAHDRALGARRGGELQPHPRAGRAAARRADRAGEGGQHLLGLGRGRLQAARHLRLPLRDDQGAAGRGGPVGRRPGLRGADGARARDLARAAARARAPERRRQTCTCSTRT